jgi:hypothetical protein
MDSANTIGLVKSSETAGALCAGGVTGAHLNALQPAQCKWAPEASFVLSEPPLSPLMLTRPQEINEGISWGRVRGASGGSEGAKVGTLLSSVEHQQSQRGNQ